MKAHPIHLPGLFLQNFSCSFRFECIAMRSCKVMAICASSECGLRRENRNQGASFRTGALNTIHLRDATQTIEHNLNLWSQSSCIICADTFRIGRRFVSSSGMLDCFHTSFAKSNPPFGARWMIVKLVRKSLLSIFSFERRVAKIRIEENVSSGCAFVIVRVSEQDSKAGPPVLLSALSLEIALNR